MILITGATGLVGSHLVQALQVPPDNIIATYLTSTPPKHLMPLARWQQLDILDIDAVEQIMKGVTQVYHCAAMVSFNPKEKRLLHQLNINGTANIVNACLDDGVEKLVYVSSVASLGRAKKSEPISEKMNWVEDANNSEYSKSKYFAEMEVWRGIGEGLSAAIVNPTIILGAGNWHNGSTGIFKTVYDEFPWYTNGSTGFVDVKDVVPAMIMLMNSNVVNERFILNGWNLPYRKVFDEIATQFNKQKPYKKVTPFLAELVWRFEKLKSIFTAKNPLLTRETAHAAQTNISYNNNKFLEQFPEFKYTDFETAMKRICDELKIKYNLVQSFS